MYWDTQYAWPAGTGDRATGARAVPQGRVDRMGRPKKEVDARRSAPVLVKLTTAERDRLAGEARRVRAPLAAFVRERALSARSARR